jgi:hypothetical protein
LSWVKKNWYRYSKKAGLYQRTFAGRDASFVLADLAKFCYVAKPTPKVNPITGGVDPLATMLAEGRREVFLRITAYLNLTQEDVAKMRTIEDSYDNEDEATQ